MNLEEDMRIKKELEKIRAQDKDIPKDKELFFKYLQKKNKQTEAEDMK